MTRLLSTIFLLLSGLSSFGQLDTVFIRQDRDDINGKVNYKTDTFYFPSPMRRHILKGTDILSGTSNQFVASQYGINLTKVTQSDCKQDATMEFIPAKINSIQNTAEELIVDFSFTDNCCYSFLCDIAIVNNNTLNLIFYGYGTHCDCDCCHGLTFRMTKEETVDNKKITSVMINGNIKTLTQLKKTTK